MVSRTREVGHPRSRNYTRAMNFTASGNQPQQHAVRNPGTRFSRVLPDHNAGMRVTANQVVTQCPANEIGAFHGQREFAGHAANAVGAEELSSLRCHSDLAGWAPPVTEIFCMMTVTRTGSGLAT